MKRKSDCLIELLETGNDAKIGYNTTQLTFESIGKHYKMFTSSPWYLLLLKAEKLCVINGNIKKVHYKFPDDKEMVEEYNMDTSCLVRRAWKTKSNLGGEGIWDIEIGDPIPPAIKIELEGIIESSDQPILLRRNTRINLEWRIRNLPYPIENYSISANNDERRIIIRTVNKKYFKKLEIPELDRLNLPLCQANIQYTHKYNTLIVLYQKPKELLDMEKAWYEVLKDIKPQKDLPDDCKPS